MFNKNWYLLTYTSQITRNKLILFFLKHVCWDDERKLEWQVGLRDLRNGKGKRYSVLTPSLHLDPSLQSFQIVLKSSFWLLYYRKIFFFMIKNVFLHCRFAFYCSYNTLFLALSMLGKQPLFRAFDSHSFEARYELMTSFLSSLGDFKLMLMPHFGRFQSLYLDRLRSILSK